MTLNDLKTAPLNEMVKKCDISFLYFNTNPATGEVAEIEVRYVPQDIKPEVRYVPMEVAPNE